MNSKYPKTLATLSQIKRAITEEIVIYKERLIFKNKVH